MAYLNIASLPFAPAQSASRLNEDVRSFSETGRTLYHVFLSYRHEDRAYVPRVAMFLKNLQAGVYVDFLDEELNNASNSQTAPILRERITQCRKLIQIITPNAGASRWMPWELGLGDGLLGYDNSVVLPLIDNVNSRVEQDYIAMYGHIETSYSNDRTINDWAIIYPNRTNRWFGEWLKN